MIRDGGDMDNAYASVTLFCVSRNLRENRNVGPHCYTTRWSRSATHRCSGGGRGEEAYFSEGAESQEILFMFSNDTQNVIFFLLQGRSQTVLKREGMGEPISMTTIVILCVKNYYREGGEQSLFRPLLLGDARLFHCKNYSYAQRFIHSLHDRRRRRGKRAAEIYISNSLISVVFKQADNFKARIRIQK